ncbi:MAG: murein biosynthesis integral membrane protein MurJ [Coriobacteriales bacterium]|nr:murein biosynthesis integral membrane protein MurJ [Coriobacteriales bacterium]
MSTATTLSRVTGFVRMWSIAFALGATGLMSAYSVANNIPNMLFELVAGGIISSIFIPMLLEIRAQRSPTESDRFASHVFNLAVVALGVIAFVGTLFPQPFIWTQTFRLSGAEAEQVRSAAEFFFRFFAIQIVIYGAGSIMQARLNASRKYLWPALGPVFNNFVVIGTMFAYVALREAPGSANVVLAVGTTLGVVAIFGVQVPSLIKLGVNWSPGLGLHDPDVRKMLVLAVPSVVYVVASLVGVSFRNASAFAVMPEGPSVLTYAWTFYQLPYGILAVALATAVFTELSEAAGLKDWTAFKDQFSRGLRATGVLMLPASALLVALATPLVTLYRIGAFGEDAVPIVAGALRWWAAGLIFFAASMYVLRTFYSLKDTRTPAVVNVALTGLQVGLYYVLSTGIGAWAGLGINGIPIADGIFFAVKLVALTWLLRRAIGSFDLRTVAGTYARMLAASVLAAGLAFGIVTLMAPYTPGVAGALTQVFVAGTIGLVAAWLLARLFGVTEVSIVTTMLRRALGRLGRRSAS